MTQHITTKSQSPLLLNERYSICYNGTLNNHHSFLTILMSIGFVATSIPQMHKIIKYQSSDGLSPVYLTLSVIGGIMNISNIILIQFPIFTCCEKVWNTKICLRNLLTIFQQLIHAACQVAILFLYFKYDSPDDTDYSLGYNRLRRMYLGRSSLDMCMRITLTTLILSFSTVIIIITFFHDPEGDQTKLEKNAAYLFGIISSAVVSAQMLPQIIKTSREKDIKSLSIETLFLQSIGSFLVAFIIALQPRVNPSSWISYIIGGLAQVTLLHICLKLYRKNGITFKDLFMYSKR